MCANIEFSVYTYGLALILILLTAADGYPYGNSHGDNINDLLMPDGCGGSEYCTKPYDTRIERQIESLLTDTYGVMLASASDTFDVRNGYESYESGCKNFFGYDPIYHIVDENNKVRAVVQSKNHFMQIIRVETCASPGRITDNKDNNNVFFTHTDLETYNITCQQKKMHYSFLVLSLDGKSLEMVRSKTGIPVYCACLFNEEPFDSIESDS